MNFPTLWPMIFALGDLRDPYFCRQMIDRRFDEIYRLAADMGAPASSSPARTMPRSCTIRTRSISMCSMPAAKRGIRRVFYSSSACIYPAYNQEDAERPNCAEDSVYPVAPDSEYG
jgi:GDP-D-mannose 3', 5'-epimerase